MNQTIEDARPGHDALRVVIADDQQLLRTGFRMILAADGIEVVGEAADGSAAIDVVRETRPDVVLMDIRMPALDGLEATRRILGARQGEPRSEPHHALEPAPRIIILTTFDLDQYVYEALAAGASGFLLKDVTPEHLVGAVRLVRSGDALLAPAITRRLVEKFAAPAATTQAAPRAHNPSAEISALTARELEVFRLLARGLSNAELAERFCLSEATVKTHVARILAKLQLRDRAQAVVAAYETGVVTPGNAEA